MTIPSALRPLPRRLLRPAMLYLACLPPVLLLSVFRFPGSLPAAWALLLLSFALCALCVALPGRLRKIAAAVCAAALLMTGAALLPLRAQPVLLVLPAACAAALLLALPFAARTVADTPPAFYLSGLLAQLLSYAFIRLSYNPQGMRLLPVLTAAFAVYLLLLLLSLNRISLDNATMARCPLPASMRRANTLLTLAFLLLSLLAASLPLMVRLLIACRNLIFGALRMAFVWLSRLLPDAPGAGGGMGAGIPQMPVAEAVYEEPSFFSLLFERFMLIVTYLVLIAGTLLLIRLLIRLALRAVRIIAARLARYSAAVSGDYIDEITDTREEDGRSQSYALRAIRRFTPSAAPEEAAARIRWRYARLLHRSRSWADSSTARENLPAEAAALYERARYSDLPVTTEDAARFDEQVRKL